MFEIRIKDLPPEIGMMFTDSGTRNPRRYFDDNEIEKVWNIISEKIKGKLDVDLHIVGLMPVLMPARLTYHCLQNKVRSFYFSLPGGLPERVYDERMVSA